MSHAAREIKEITQKEFQDYLQDYIDKHEATIDDLKAKIGLLRSLLYDLEGLKIVEEKK